MNLWFCLSKENQERIAKQYKERFGVEFIPPKWERRAIHCEAKLESLEEIAKTMKEVPGYAIDVQGREG